MSTSLLSSYATTTGPIAEPISIEMSLPRSRKGKRLLIIVLIISLIAVNVLLAFYAFMAWFLARPTIAPLHSNPQAKLGLAYEDVSIQSANGASTIEGWLIPASSKKSFVFSHGYGGNREEVWIPLYTLANELHQRGYNVLMFDYGYASPGGNKLMTGGIQESEELLGAIQFLKVRGMEEVYVWGFSMGAGTALQAALHEPEIDGMILDSTFILNSDTLYHNVKQVVNLPKFPTVPLVQMFSSIINGVGMKDIPHERVLSKSFDVPIFFIHGDNDHRAPYELSEQMAANQDNKLSQLWIVPKGEHELIYQTKPELYLEHAFGFLQNVEESRAKLALAQ